MAALSPILVSSSLSHSFIATTPPHRPSRTASMSSSPGLPSPSRLFAKKIACQLSPGRNSAIAGFTSASNLLLSAYASDHEGSIKTRRGLGESTDLQYRKGKATQSKELLIEKEDSAISSVRKCNTISRFNTAAFDEKLELSCEAKPSNIQKPEKKPTKKSIRETQTTIKKSKIIKPISISDSTARKTKTCVSTKKTGITKQSAAKALVKKTEDTVVYPVGEEPLDLGLVEAIKRRRTWTPTKDTVQHITNLEDYETTSDISLYSRENADEERFKSGFDLFGDYGYAKNDNSPIFDLEKSRDERGEALTKRHKLELVNLACYPPAPPSPVKRLKLPRKKPQTITEKATAPFLPEDSASTSLLDYFGIPVREQNEDVRNKNKVSVISNASSLQQKPNDKAKNKPVTSKAKTKKEQAPVLLSPKTAINSAEDQELVFGTSSQLVRDESPSFLEDMQQAIEESRLIDEQITSTPKDLAVGFGSNLSRAGGVTPFTSSRNLWSVAARDPNGSLLNVEVVDLIDTPKPFKISPPLLGPATPAGTSNPGPVSADELQIITEPLRSRLETSNHQNPLTKSIADQSIPRSLAEASLRKRPRSQSPVKKHKATKGSGMLLEPVPGQMPNYQGFTTVQLSKAIAANGFKSIKKRGDMIALLERCWDSRSRMASQGLPASASLPVPYGNKDETFKDPSPLKKKGRSRKAGTAAIAGDDSTTGEPANNLPPKKPRGRPKKDTSITSSKKGANPIQASSTITQQAVTGIQTQVMNSAVLGSTSPATLLSCITRAITTFPPTHSATRLTFHEKILLFEPIVLEDLTAWLNTEGLGRIDVDEEVSVGLVREWCMARGVCSVSKKEGWRAKRG